MILAEYAREHRFDRGQVRIGTAEGGGFLYIGELRQLKLLDLDMETIEKYVEMYHKTQSSKAQYLSHILSHRQYGDRWIVNIYESSINGDMIVIIEGNEAGPLNLDYTKKEVYKCSALNGTNMSRMKMQSGDATSAGRSAMSADSASRMTSVTSCMDM